MRELLHVDVLIRRRRPGQNGDVDANGSGGGFGCTASPSLLHGVAGTVCSAIGAGPSAASSVVSSGADVRSELFGRAVRFEEGRGVLVVNAFEAVGCLEDHCRWEG